ncbi:uncharacterized protein EV420DRAFT_1528476 [Desarmillaria tabescens]|uniref:MYND-type domain-containing protein n=1 Tax=Armillaria tabescens TaxID=1929756 RepID=A0AA39MII9_ARMTA|nr:uncharacterized protein EV420DRAFT_1594553 [Desarmillaria tabescens]XP_060333779.1 uncharacterized protein EV420DRAFT_1528476 [Desarmillaria tabescens]KAK0435108.1 hypothetical protein EV420DRAFT_1594553 [Desarmillaria tabescens]KAK0462041.1 hypothetical protein EV420DRAFT_1528476 [Desarmillaria tabescens]
MERYKKEAINGSLPALLALSQDTTKNVTLFPVIVKSIRQHLLTTPIPTTPADPLFQEWQDDNMTTIHTCLVSLKSAISHLEPEDACSIALVSRLWPDLCRYITVFLDIHVVDVSPSLLPSLYEIETWFTMVDAILSLLLVLSRKSQWWSLMIETPEFILSLTNTVICLIAVSEDLSFQARSFNLMSSFCKPVGDDPIPAMVYLMQKMPSERIIHLFEGIVSRTQTLDPSSYALTQCLNIMYFTTIHSECFARHFLIHHSVFWICRLMSRITAELRRDRPRPSLEVMKGLEGNIYICCAYLLKVCFTKGYRWLLQAIERHLLELILKSLPFALSLDSYGNTTLIALLTELCDVVYTFLVQRSIIVACKKGMDKIASASLEENLSHADDSFRQAWTRLKEQVVARMLFRATFIGQGCDNDSCARQNCPRRFTNREKPLQLCSGCLYYSYCSRECQKAMWPEHKKFCKKLRDMRTNGYMMHITSRDEHFLEGMKLCDIYDNAHSIKEQAQHVRQDYPPVIVLDYATAPMTITVKSSLDFKDLEVSASSWDKLVKEARSLKGELVYVRLPELSRIRESFQCVALQMDVLRA